MCHASRIIYTTMGRCDVDRWLEWRAPLFATVITSHQSPVTYPQDKRLNSFPGVVHSASYTSGEGQGEGKASSCVLVPVVVPRGYHIEQSRICLLTCIAASRSAIHISKINFTSLMQKNDETVFFAGFRLWLNSCSCFVNFLQL